MGLLSLPFRGLIRVFEEVAKRAEAELFDHDAVAAELSELYRQLEAGAISEHEFGDREASIVARLATIEAHMQRRARRGAR